jgi:hypothetical protein
LELILKQFRSALLVLFSIIIVLSVIIDDNTAAWFLSDDQLTANFSAADDFGGPSLQDHLDQIIADLLQDSVLEGAHQNFYPKHSWSYRIQAYVSGGSNNSNIYGFENPVSQSGRVLRSAALWGGEQDSNPMLFITNNFFFSHGWIRFNAQYSRLFGSLILYKPNNPSPMEYFVIDEEGELGELNTLELPQMGKSKSNEDGDNIPNEPHETDNIIEEDEVLESPDLAEDPTDSVDHGGNGGDEDQGGELVDQDLEESGQEAEAGVPGAESEADGSDAEDDEEGEDPEGGNDVEDQPQAENGGEEESDGEELGDGEESTDGNEPNEGMGDPIEGDAADEDSLDDAGTAPSQDETGDE